MYERTSVLLHLVWYQLSHRPRDLDLAITNHLGLANETQRKSTNLDRVRFWDYVSPSPFRAFSKSANIHQSVLASHLRTVLPS